MRSTSKRPGRRAAASTRSGSTTWERDDDGDPTDPDGGNTDAILARLAKEHPDLFGKDKAYGANRRGKRAGKYPGTGPSGKPQIVGS